MVVKVRKCKPEGKSAFIGYRTSKRLMMAQFMLPRTELIICKRLLFVLSRPCPEALSSSEGEVKGI